MTKTRSNRPENIPDFPAFSGDLILDTTGILRTERIKIIAAGWRRHAAFLFSLYEQEHGARQISADMNPAQQQQALTNGFARDHILKIRHYPTAGFGIILKRGYPVGQITVWRATDQIRILDLSVLPDWIDRGIPEILTHLLQTEADSLGIPLILDRQ